MAKQSKEKREAVLRRRKKKAEAKVVKAIRTAAEKVAERALEEARKQNSDLATQREVLMRVIATLTVEKGGVVELGYRQMMSAPPIKIEVLKDASEEEFASRVRISVKPGTHVAVAPELGPRIEMTTGCCDSPHPRDEAGEVVDKACSGFEAGADPKSCVYCAHAERCHPGSPDDPRPVGSPLGPRNADVVEVDPDVEETFAP